MNVDDMLSAADPAPSVPAYESARARELLARATTAAPVAAPRRRSARSAAAIGAVVVLAGGGGVAYAVLGPAPDRAMRVACAASTDRAAFERVPAVGSYLTNASGDPVAECAREYERLGGTAPDLVAYATGEAFITVVPSDWVVPADWQPLQPTFRTDPARVELESRLADQVDGLGAECRDAAAAEAIVRRDLADLGLTAWTTRRLDQADRADGSAWCAVAFPDWEGTNTVLVQGVQAPNVVPGAGDGGVTAVVEALREGIAEQCVPLEAATTVAEQAVRDAGYDPRTDASITALPDPDAACSRVDFVPAGAIAITVRGPG